MGHDGERRAGAHSKPWRFPVKFPPTPPNPTPPNPTPPNPTTPAAGLCWQDTLTCMYICATSKTSVYMFIRDYVISTRGVSKTCTGVRRRKQLSKKTTCRASIPRKLLFSRVVWNILCVSSVMLFVISMCFSLVMCCHIYPLGLVKQYWPLLPHNAKLGNV